MIALTGEVENVWDRKEQDARDETFTAVYRGERRERRERGERERDHTTNTGDSKGSGIGEGKMGEGNKMGKWDAGDDLSGNETYLGRFSNATTLSVLLGLN